MVIPIEQICLTCDWWDINQYKCTCPSSVKYEADTGMEDSCGEWLVSEVAQKIHECL